MISIRSLIEEISTLSNGKFNNNQLAKKMGKSRQWVNLMLNHGLGTNPVNQVKMLIAMQDYLLEQVIESEITIKRQQQRIEQMNELRDVIRLQINDVAMNIKENL